MFCNTAILASPGLSAGELVAAKDFKKDMDLAWLLPFIGGVSPLAE